ncbi:MAG TPA: prealbumin-like fold domain-containing protein, partial [Dehalococcoidia bacterium]|nr:prealbumin-like fold domain-containing protein [Dehalococcoidia bacterium]
MTGFSSDPKRRSDGVAGSAAPPRTPAAVPHRSGPGRYGKLVVSLFSAAVAVWFASSMMTQAVHDDGFFELEGDIADGPASPPDWASIFGAGGDVAHLDGGVAAAFIADDISPAGLNDDTVFTSGGTKNEQQPSEDWNWGTQSVPAKDDLSNVYAFGILDDRGELIVYAGVERLATEGASHVDLEFNAQEISLDEAPPCDDEPCHFLGDKTPGDVLVAMDFRRGGALGELRVYQWSGDAYIQVNGAYLSGEGCNDPGGFAGGVICAFNNDGPADDGGPWVNYDRHGDEIADLEENSFTEFGVNLTALLGDTPCITSFMAHTRTSPGPRKADPIDSELKDFAGPEPLPLCGLRWEKRDGGGEALAGATFEVCRIDVDPHTCVTVVDGGPNDDDPADGVFSYFVATAGTYRVCETAAPSGYIADPGCQTVQVLAPGTYLLEFPFINNTPT